jgi:AbiV family abortive infection protein
VCYNVIKLAGLIIGTDETMRLTSIQLVQGAVYAIEDAYNRLKDADLLYREKRYGNALALTILGREALGLFEKLLEDLKNTKASGGTDITVSDIDHLKRLRQGQQGNTLSLSAQQGQKLIELNEKTNNSKEYRKYRASLSGAAKRKGRRHPEAMFKLRERALSVDPTEDGGWNRPSQVSCTEVCKALIETTGDYNMIRERIDLHEPGLKKAMDDWSDCPKLPGLDLPEPP